MKLIVYALVICILMALCVHTDKSYTSRTPIDSNHVNVVTIAVSFALDSTITEDEAYKNSIDIPHCSAVFYEDTVIYLAYPSIYKKNTNTIVVIKYVGDKFSFSRGGDDVDVSLLRTGDLFRVPAALDKSKYLYEFDSQSLPPNRTVEFKYKVKDKLVVEKHKIDVVYNVKFEKAEEDRDCD